MGRYINNLPDGSTLPAKRKADIILKNVPGAQEIAPPTEWSDDLVCVVENGNFDAAGYAYSPSEMEQFLYPTMRPRRWLKVPGAAQLAPEERY